MASLRAAVASLVAALLFSAALAWGLSSLVPLPPSFIRGKGHPPDPTTASRVADAEHARLYEVENPTGGLPGHVSAAGVTYDDVAFPTQDGMTLRGWHVRGSGARRGLVVTVHGAGPDRREFLTHVPMVTDAGFDMLMFDQREMGTSDRDGVGLAYGFREHHDVRAAVDYAHTLVDVNGELPATVGILAMSAGGAASVLAMGRNSTGVAFLVSVASFTRVENVVANFFPTFLDKVREAAEPTLGATVASVIPYLIPHAFSYLVADLAVWRMSGRGQPAPIDLAGNLTIPYLILHGDEDALVPVEMSQQLHDAAIRSPDRGRILLPGGVHKLVQLAAIEQYQEHVVAFMHKHSASV